MSSPSHDPAQLLANLFENGQAMMRQFTSGSGPDAADMSDPMAAFRTASESDSVRASASSRLSG